MIPGLSYGARTGSLAYPLRLRSVACVHQPTARAIVELVHPGQFRVLPPSPQALATKGEMMGLIKYAEMWHTVYW